MDDLEDLEKVVTSVVGCLLYVGLLIFAAGVLLGVVIGVVAPRLL